MSRSELAMRYYDIHRCTASVLRDRYGLSINTCKQIITQANTLRKVERQKALYYLDNPEKEIEGLPYQYDPEKDIRHIQITY